MAGSLKLNGIRSCSPARMVAFFAPPDTVMDKFSDHSHSHSTVSRELLMTTSCFSKVSPGRKLWSLLVKLFGLPAIQASSGRLLRSSASPAAVGTQSDLSPSMLIQPC